MKTLYASIIFVVLLFISFLSGYKFYEYKNPPKPPEIKIVKEYKTIYKKPPEISYRDCYLSDLKIQHEITDYSALYTDMTITASDACKSKNQDIRIEVHQSENWKFYAGAVLVGAGICWLVMK